jgi:hypothetical protein
MYRVRVPARLRGGARGVPAPARPRMALGRYFHCFHYTFKARDNCRDNLAKPIG